MCEQSGHGIGEAGRRRCSDIGERWVQRVQRRCERRPCSGMTRGSGGLPRVDATSESVILLGEGTKEAWVDGGVYIVIEARGRLAGVTGDVARVELVSSLGVSAWKGVCARPRTVFLPRASSSTSLALCPMPRP